MGNALFHLGEDKYDIPRVDNDNVFLREIVKSRDEMTGWERVAAAFSTDMYGDFSPEMCRIKDATSIGIIMGGFIGATGRGRIAYMDFMRKNNITQFETPLQAKKYMQDHITLSMGSGAFRIGWRIGIFTFMYMTGATIISSYRGKVGILDQAGGAGIAGFLYKFKDGPKATLSGTLFGTSIGLFAGTITWLVLKIFGLDLATVNMSYHKKLAERKEKEHAALKATRKDDNSEMSDLQQFHQSVIEELSKTPDSEDVKTSGLIPPVKVAERAKKVDLGFSLASNNSNSSVLSESNQNSHENKPR